MDGTEVREPSFRDSVDIMFNRAAAMLDLPSGMAEKIRVANSTYRSKAVSALLIT